MEAEEHGWRVGRDEFVDDVCEWMVVVRCQWEGGVEIVVPVLVVFCEERGFRVEDIAMQDVGEDLRRHCMSAIDLQPGIDLGQDLPLALEVRVSYP